MEKITNRTKFTRNFVDFCNKVKLNQQFIDELIKHKCFREEMQTVMQLSDVMARKVYILLEFTRLRSTCEEIIKLLRSSGQTEAANELELYNTSPGRIQISTETAIRVTPAKAEMKGTLYYVMSKMPRGRCIIINNIVEYFKGNLCENSGLYKESKRFESIFTQLHFDVEPINSTVGMNANAIRGKLEAISRNKRLFEDEALVVMIISHGCDEKVLGYDACQQKNDNDVIKISEIVDIFSEENCSALRLKPKLFFFICCRNKEELPAVGIQLSPNDIPVNIPIYKSEVFIDLNLKPNENRVLLSLKTIDQTWINKNRDTFISYSCSEGYKSFYNEAIGISYFGQALSHSIAQYACEESLQSILSRTCVFIENNTEDFSKSAPELRGQCMRRQLCFNPGFHR